MVALVVPSMLALLLSMLFGGSLSAWSTLRVHWWPVAGTSLLVQAVLFSPLLEEQPWAIAWGPWLYVATMAGVLLALLASARVGQVGRLALSVAAIGVALNCMVVALNSGYMPRSERATALLGRSPTARSDEANPRLVNVQPIDEATRLAWLGDIIPEPGWLPLANVVSIGDLLLSGGLAWWTVNVTSPSAGWPIRRRRFDAGCASGEPG